MEPQFQRHDAASARAIATSVIVPLYQACNPDLAQQPFHSTARFAERLHAYTCGDGFDLYLATDPDTGQTLGQIFGYALPPDARWWDGLITGVPSGFTDEDGRRTFAINEIMVRPEHRRRGIARALHDHLLTHRGEQRATLLVEPDNTPARTAYLRWGWRDVTRLQPFPDAPLYHAMIIELPLRPRD